MNKNLIFGAVGVLVIVVIGYLLFNRQTEPIPQPEITITPQTASPSAAISGVTVTLSEQNASGESGIATLVEVDGQAVVILALTGAPEDVVQPAHIHVGSCPDVGAVKYPLTFPVNGRSKTTLDVSLDQLRLEMPLAINVHKSAQEASVYVSCSNLSL